MISRTLGKEFGGSTGILFYFGNTVGFVMYILGLVEILTNYVIPQMSIGDSYTNARVYGTALLIMISCIVMVGKNLVAKTSVTFFVAVTIAIASALAGLFSSNRPGLIK